MPTRTKVNLTIDKDRVVEARRLGINMSRVADEAIGEALKTERWRIWREENAEAIENYNEMIKRDGIPFASHRKF